MHLDCQSSFFEVIGLETFLTLAIDTLQIHFYSLLRLTAMLIAIGRLVIQILSVIFPVLFCSKQVAEKAAFEGCITLLFQVCGFFDKVTSLCLDHLYLKNIL